MKYFLFIITLCFSLTIFAKKARVPFEIMVMEADEIVVGKITKVLDSTLVLEVINDVKRGKQTRNNIELNFWKTWRCDYRRFQYEKEISVMFFLKKDSKSDTYNILHGSSGELKIEIDSVTIERFGKVDVATVIESTQFLTRCFKYVGDYWFDGRSGCYLKKECAENEIKDFWNRNEFNQWLFSSIEESDLLVEKWFYELDYKDPISVIRGLQYAAKTKDYDFLSLLVDPKFDNDENVDLLDFFDEEDRESLRLLKKFDCNYDVIEVSIGKHYCVYELRFSQKTICNIILVKRYSNWYLEQIRYS